MITTCSPGDLPWILQSVKRLMFLMSDIDPQTFPPSQNHKTLAYYTDCCNGKHPDVLLLRADHDGFLSCCIDQKRNSFWIKHFYVWPKARHSGIGSALMDHAKSLRSLYCPDLPIGLHCLPGNKRALRFYLSHNFAPTGKDSSGLVLMCH